MNIKNYIVVLLSALPLAISTMQSTDRRALTTVALGLNTALPPKKLGLVQAAARKYPGMLTSFFDTKAKAHILELLASTKDSAQQALLHTIFTQWQSIDTWPFLGASHPLNEGPYARAMRPLVCQLHILREHLKRQSR